MKKLTELENEILKLKGKLMFKGYKSRSLDITVLKLYSIMDTEKISKEIQYKMIYEMLKLLESAQLKTKKKRTRSSIKK